jgi:hypothetical protein
MGGVIGGMWGAASCCRLGLGKVVWVALWLVIVWVLLRCEVSVVVIVPVDRWRWSVALVRIRVVGWRVVVCDRRTKIWISVWREKPAWRLTVDGNVVGLPAGVAWVLGSGLVMLGRWDCHLKTFSILT